MPHPPGFGREDAFYGAFRALPGWLSVPETVSLRSRLGRVYNLEISLFPFPCIMKLLCGGAGLWLFAAVRQDLKSFPNGSYAGPQQRRQLLQYENVSHACGQRVSNQIGQGLYVFPVWQ